MLAMSCKQWALVFWFWCCFGVQNLLVGLPGSQKTVLWCSSTGFHRDCRHIMFFSVHLNKHEIHPLSSPKWCQLQQFQHWQFRQVRFCVLYCVGELRWKNVWRSCVAMLASRVLDWQESGVVTRRKAILMVIGKLLVYPGWPGKGSNSWTGVLGKIKTFANFFKMGIASKWNILSMDLVLEVLASRRPTRLAMASNKSPEWAVPRFWLTRLGNQSLFCVFRTWTQQSKPKVGWRHWFQAVIDLFFLDLFHDSFIQNIVKFARLAHAGQVAKTKRLKGRWWMARVKKTPEMPTAQNCSNLATIMKYRETSWNIMKCDETWRHWSWTVEHVLNNLCTNLTCISLNGSVCIVSCQGDWYS